MPFFSSKKPSSFREKILLSQGEKIVKEENVRYEGGLTYQAKKVDGLLTFTTHRIIFVADKGELGRDEKVVINFPLDRLFTGESRARLITSLLDKAKVPQIASIFGDFITISFEDWFGVLQRPRFKTKNAIEWSDMINNVMATKVPDQTPIVERRREHERFKEFVTYLASEKAISPLEFDPTSRVILVGSNQIFLDNSWIVTTTESIKPTVESWIKSFGAKR
ncbi:MAG: hypothetical protein QXE82_05465 [Candidatus Nitrosotenuis sp.]